ncbi:hypothetical protein AK812_SmicGene25416 [Symbiodinium microadriaticum]|uniref:Uncharacterized protein n=1 Tax=Symbiodinium microadriaticum TaxID=2951 RepID=A0A1Q9DC79_SYMMI|nr:hypothetical protein AK812_SmicGene25416 [Symbiodinium microadriaticum]CAE7851680.1 unnamed protein product [Symbiodinium microadriaticum]
MVSCALRGVPVLRGFKLVRVQALTVRKLGSACAPECGLQVARRHGQSSFVTSRLATASLDAPLFCMGQGGSAALLRPWPAQEAQSMRRAQSLGASCIPQAVQDKEASSSKSSSVVWNSSEGVSMSSKCAAFDVTSCKDVLRGRVRRFRSEPQSLNGLLPELRANLHGGAGAPYCTDKSHLTIQMRENDRRCDCEVQRFEGFFIATPSKHGELLRMEVAHRAEAAGKSPGCSAYDPGLRAPKADPIASQIQDQRAFTGDAVEALARLAPWLGFARLFIQALHRGFCVLLAVLGCRLKATGQWPLTVGCFRGGLACPARLSLPAVWKQKDGHEALCRPRDVHEDEDAGLSPSCRSAEEAETRRRPGSRVRSSQSFSLYVAYMRDSADRKSNI